MSKIVLANNGIIISGPKYLSHQDVMDFFPHLGHEISEAHLVIPFITNISVIIIKMNVFIKHLHKTN